MVSVVIQFQEDDPNNPGWWRLGRPVHRILDSPPEIRDSQWWYYGTAEDAESDGKAWDLARKLGH